MRSSTILAGLASLAASALAFTITSPTSSDYWVQGDTNRIAWSTASGDPSVASLQIVNANRTLLNGAFAIAEYVKASLMSFTVTNVTLIVADGYVVQMVNSTNNTQVLASSGTFSVKPAGTTPAPIAGSSDSQTSSNATTGTTGSGTNATTTTGNTAHNTGTSNSNAGSNAKSAAVSVSTPIAGLLMASLAAISFVAL